MSVCAWCLWRASSYLECARHLDTCALPPHHLLHAHLLQQQGLHIRQPKLVLMLLTPSCTSNLTLSRSLKCGCRTVLCIEVQSRWCGVVWCLCCVVDVKLENGYTACTLQHH